MIRFSGHLKLIGSPCRHLDWGYDMLLTITLLTMSVSVQPTFLHCSCHIQNKFSQELYGAIQVWLTERQGTNFIIAMPIAMYLYAMILWLCWRCSSFPNNESIP